MLTLEEHASYRENDPLPMPGSDRGVRGYASVVR
jgi:hypothetical protein